MRNQFTWHCSGWGGPKVIWIVPKDNLSGDCETWIIYNLIYIQLKWQQATQIQHTAIWLYKSGGCLCKLIRSYQFWGLNWTRIVPENICYSIMWNWLKTIAIISKWSGRANASNIIEKENTSWQLFGVCYVPFSLHFGSMPNQIKSALNKSHYPNECAAKTHATDHDEL